MNYWFPFICGALLFTCCSKPKPADPVVTADYRDVYAGSYQCMQYRQQNYHLATRDSIVNDSAAVKLVVKKDLSSNTKIYIGSRLITVTTDGKSVENVFTGSTAFNKFSAQFTANAITLKEQDQKDKTLTVTITMSGVK
ncbi:MAG: hypothetical protein V4616_02230 [Bacteroidota bacterium]